jgi:hypothetical protein
MLSIMCFVEVVIADWVIGFLFEHRIEAPTCLE